MRVASVFMANLGIVLLTSLSTGQLITYSYEAAELGGPGIVTGTLEFDSSIPDSFPTNPDFGQYSGAGKWTGQVIGGELDGANFDFSNLLVNIFDSPDPAFDSLTMNFGASNVLMSDLSGLAFANDSLPNNLDLENFDTASLLINEGDIFGNEGPSGNQTVLFTLTSIQAIPEPSVAMVLGIAAIVGTSGRRRNKILN